MSNHFYELIAPKTILEERVFLYKVVDFLIDTFSTEPLESNAPHVFETLRQHKEEPVSEYVEQASMVAKQSNKLLFGNQRVVDRKSELAKNVNTVIAGLFYKEVKHLMGDWTADFVGGIPTEERFGERLQTVVIMKREFLLKSK